MTPYKKRKCEITRRLAEDMMIRHLADATIDAYTYHVRRFADFIDKPLAQATVEDVRTFQLYLIQDTARYGFYTPTPSGWPGRWSWFPSANDPKLCQRSSADKKSTDSCNAHPI